jgi:hypothetical protein
MNNKSPFEIRTRMLELATEYLQHQYEAAEKLATSTFGELVEAGVAVQSEWIKYAPKMYEFPEIIKKAQELYGFVSKRD